MLSKNLILISLSPKIVNLLFFNFRNSDIFNYNLTLNLIDRTTGMPLKRKKHSRQPAGGHR